MKAQITMEYVYIMAIATIFALTMTLYFTGQFAESSRQKTMQDAENIANILKIELTTAEKVHDGYNRDVFLPNEISGRNYSVIINGNELTVYIDSYESTAIIPKVKGNFSKGINRLTKTDEGLKIT